MTNTLSGLFAGGALVLGLSGCSDQVKVDPVVAQCKRARPELPVTHLQQSFKVVNTQNNEIIIVTGKPDTSTSTSTYVSVSVYGPDEENEGMGWKRTGQRMDVNVKGSGFTCSLLDSTGGGIVYPGPSGTR